MKWKTFFTFLRINHTLISMDNNHGGYCPLEQKSINTPPEVTNHSSVAAALVVSWIHGDLMRFKS